MKQYLIRLRVWSLLLAFAVALVNALGPSSSPAAAAPGDLDATFGFLGRVITDFGADEDTANALLLQPDGKLVAAGRAPGIFGNPDFGLARYNSNVVSTQHSA